ncbi:hypothetical protein [Bosea vaviloviae]|nr:hypothetical protein [Bosea vaviloviae]
MTTKKQIKFLLDLIQSRNADLVVHGPFAVLKPIRHVIRAISIDRTSSADRPHFLWSIGHTFNPRSSLQGIWLDQFYTERGAPAKWSEPGLAEAFIDAVEGTILPRLRPASTIEAMTMLKYPYSYGYESQLRYEPYQLHFHAACGRFGEAIRILEKMETWERSKLGWRLHEFQYLVDELGPLLKREDKIGVAELLRQWEVMVVRRAGVANIYEPTPFPFELA